MPISIYSHASGAQLEYQTFGTGNQTLICFHGFGQNTDSFACLEEHLPNHTLISIRLFYHGGSRRSPNAPGRLHTPEWKELFADFLSELQIDRFSLLAYSMGGRFALATLSSFVSQVEQVILVAADGLVKRFSYQLATAPLVCRLFRYWMSHPTSFFWMMNRLEAIGILNPSLFKFARTQLQSATHRTLVYHTWTAFKYFGMSQKELLRLIHSQSLPITFIFGTKDRVIAPQAHHRFLAQIPQNHTHILPYGHHKLVQNATPLIQDLLHHDHNAPHHLPSGD